MTATAISQIRRSEPPPHEPQVVTGPPIEVNSNDVVFVAPVASVT